ncbi:hypothetical protein AMTRI_Chr05g72250 [Amborella trichopoda]
MVLWQELSILSCSNVNLRDLHMVNGQKQHVRIDESITVFIGGLHISAPGDSPNTDGIHIQGSQHFNIENSYIATGDDCISIGDGSYDVNISQVTCGPGHGIRSLGDGGSHGTVEMVHVKISFFTDTENGGGSGFTRNIIFENLNFTAISNRIVINQYYCPDKACQNQALIDVHYIGLYGTSQSEVAVSLTCSECVACTNILLNGIDLNAANPGDTTSSYCLNAHGTIQGQTITWPHVPFTGHQVIGWSSGLL